MAISVWSLASCTHWSTTNQPLSLQLAPSELGENINLNQRLTFTHKGQSQSLDIVLEVDNNRFNLVGLLMGQRVLSLAFDGKKLQAWKQANVPAQIVPEDILSNVQLCLWPAHSIAKQLPAQWAIQDKDSTRTISYQDKPMIQITYSAMPRWAGHIQVQNLAYAYTLEIQTAIAEG